MSKTKRERLIEELTQKFDGGIPNWALGLYEDMGETELEEVLEVDKVPFKENNHYDSYIKDIKNDDYYKQLLNDYRQGNELTEKQIGKAKLVEKVLGRANKDPDYLNNNLSNAYSKDEKTEQNKRFRKEVNEELSTYRNMDAREAVEFLEEDDEITKVVPEDYKVGTENN